MAEVMAPLPVPIPVVGEVIDASIPQSGDGSQHSTPMEPVSPEIHLPAPAQDEISTRRPATHDVVDEEQPGAPEDADYDPHLLPFADGDWVEEEPEELPEPFPFKDVVFIPFPEDIVINWTDEFPFTAEEEIDHGKPFEGIFHVWEPETVESQFPFFDLTDVESLQEVIPRGNFACFFETRTQYEFKIYRNYVPGQTLKTLRKSPQFMKNVQPGTLKHLLSLPMELIYDVLELVHPMDLMHLARAGKELLGLLQHTKASKIWKASYINHSDTVPGMHSRYHGLKWTEMIFSHSLCDYCNRQGALLDFALNEHLCDECQLKHLMERDQVMAYLVPHTRQFEAIQNHSLIIPTYRIYGFKYNTMYEIIDHAKYRRKDVEAMLEELTRWYMTIDEGLIPDAGAKFDEWIAKRVEEVEDIHNSAQEANRWATNLAYSFVNDLCARQRLIATQIANRLTKLGHDQRDTLAASSDYFYILQNYDIFKMTNSLFEERKSEFIAKIDQHKRSRLQSERREFVTKLYKEFKKGLKPEKWRHLPPSEIIIDESAFCDFINSDSLEEHSPDSLPDYKEKMAKIVSEWQYNKQVELYELLPGAEMPPEVPVEHPEGATPEEIEQREKVQEETRKVAMEILMEQRMKLATTVFGCVTCKSGRHSAKAIVGWDDACSHMCGTFPGMYHTSWEFSSVGYAAAANIIRMLGLNPEVATAEEVDAVDARFFCGNCPVKCHRKLRGRKAYTWRECVLHAVDKEEDHTHAIPAWLRLSQDATDFVKRQEKPAPVARKANWGCNHCSEHFATPVSRKAAIDHVQKTHYIATPVYGTDFLDFKNNYEKGGHYRTRHIFHYSIEPACSLICKVCPPGKVPRMWTHQSLVPHLFHKHGISTPSSSRDYSKIEILAAQ